MSAIAKVGVQSTFQFTPQGPVGHLACVLSFKDPFNSDVSVNVPPRIDTVTSIFENGADGSTVLKFSTNPLPDNNLTMNPTPLDLITRQFPTLLNCPLLGALASLGNLVKTFHDIFSDADFGNTYAKVFFNGKYSYDLPAIHLSLPIKPTIIRFQEKQIILAPLIKDSYIGFYNKPNGR
jgi:hypothetical protein